MNKRRWGILAVLLLGLGIALAGHLLLRGPLGSSASRGPDAHEPAHRESTVAEPLSPDAVVTLSHLLIGHRQTTGRLPNPVLMQPMGGFPRSKREALDRIRRLHSRAFPESFADLAREHSDHRPSALWGGSLGTLRASELPPAFLQTLETLAPGQVSDVVETRLGYHLLHRRTVPKNTRLAGAQIVISYHDSADFLLRPGRSKQRTRQAALAIANRLAAEAKQEPQGFTALVQEHSDCADAVRDGDMGVWQVHEPTQNAPELEVLASLDVGATSQPLDTVWGFKILKRTANVERPTYAARVLTFPAYGSTRAVERAREQAQQVLESLEGSPEKFDELTAGPVSFMQWTEGRGIIGLLPAIQGLEIGQLSPQPIVAHNVFVIARREQPRADPPPRARPPSRSAKTPDLAQLFAVLPPPVLAQMTRQFSQVAAEHLGLGDVEHQHVRQILESLAKGLDAGGQGPALYREATEELELALGEEQSREVLEFASQWSAMARARAQ